MNQADVNERVTNFANELYDEPMELGVARAIHLLL